MTPFYHCQITENPFGEGDDPHQTHIPFFNLGTCSNSTAPCPPILFHNQRDNRAHGDDHLHQKQTQLQEEKFGQKLETIKRSTWTDYVVNRYSSYQIVREGDHKHESVKWMSSKMRIMKKMLNFDQTQIISKPRRISHQRQNQKQPNQEIVNVNTPGGTVRVCSDCNTTKTPLWRSGPRGPKSLCNACGIRQRKARRAMTASEARTGVNPMTNCYAKRDEASGVVDRTVPFKKRCRFTGYEATDQRKLNSYEDVELSLKKSTAFHRVFSQDEKDAAILLMALSCGRLCS